MKTSFLLPSNFKRIGWIIFVPFSILGLIVLFSGYEPDLLFLKVPALVFTDGIFGADKLFGIIRNNLIDEILSCIVIISAVMVAFSAEKQEDEYINKIRLESLLWAVYLNYIILFFAWILVYDVSFLYVMVINMFTILLFFIIRFNWQLSKLRKLEINEE